MPTVYIYVRVSHIRSAKSGMSKETQADAARKVLENQTDQERQAETAKATAYASYRFGNEEVTMHPEVFYDAAVSAYRVPLFERPEGRRLHLLLQPGDHVVFARLDRAFRNMNDYVKVTTSWKNKGVIIHFADIGIDFQTWQGKLMADIMSAVAEMYSAQLSERMCECAAYLKRMNRPVNGKKKLGYKVVDGQWAPDPYDRSIMAEIARLRDDENMTFNEISDHIERRLCMVGNRKYVPRTTWVKREWSTSRCFSACAAWKAILETEQPQIEAARLAAEKEKPLTAATISHMLTTDKFDGTQTFLRTQRHCDEAIERIACNLEVDESVIRNRLFADEIVETGLRRYQICTTTLF